MLFFFEESKTYEPEAYKNPESVWKMRGEREF
jgi:hypothetical protein